MGRTLRRSLQYFYLDLWVESETYSVSKGFMGLETMKLGEPLLPPLSGSRWKLLLVQQPWTSQSFSMRMEHQTQWKPRVSFHTSLTVFRALGPVCTEILDYTKYRLCLPQYFTSWVFMTSFPLIFFLRLLL